MSGPGPEHPDSGVRFIFSRGEHSSLAASFTVAIMRPDGDLSEAAVQLDRVNKTTKFDGTDGWSDWEIKTANALARTLVKGESWPRRLARWKIEK
ncbi:MAG: hypothetical protein ACJAYU_003403 [Bradymonadia bacterium]|jgi:hypothetical protein